MTYRVLALTVGLIIVAPTGMPLARQSADPVQPPATTAGRLVPTNHPRLPRELSQFWLAPAKTPAARASAPNDFASAVRLQLESKYAEALPILSMPQPGPLAHYAEYYKGVAEFRLGRPSDARQTFQALQSGAPVGYIAEAAALGEAESDEALGDRRGAAAVYERLSKEKTTAPDDVLMRFGRAAKAAGDLEKATTAFARVYFEFPMSDLSSLASAELDSLPNFQPTAPGNNRYKLELGRAERLFGAKRYGQARTGFEGLRQAARGDERELVGLRLAECDYFLKRPRNALDGVRPYLEHAARQAEALFFRALALRDLGQHDEYLSTIRRIVSEFPTQTWAEEALNNLATNYIRQDDDDAADATFREQYEKFPTGRYAERAAWKIGWRAYRDGRYPDVVSVFDRAAADFARSDTRPAWLYWSGRAHETLKEKASAEARYTLAATDYLNTYYGRLALKRLGGRLPAREPPIAEGESAGAAVQAPPTVPAAPPNEDIVRALLGLGLYDQAMEELRYAQRAYGDSSAIQATIGFIHNQRGDLRAGINAMKRAYPQYMAAGGEKLPPDLLKVLFPVSYWSLIRRYSLERDLDPYLVAALIAQESTFTADIKSAANAYGLMQIIPSTGRRYLKVLTPPKRFSIELLTTAEPNLKMGTAYFADLVKRFGGAHFALASYNAGENRVARWILEKPGVDREEFIEDIPFPETQNYVKKILGTADDYRRLYGPGGASADDADAPVMLRAGGRTPPKASGATTKKSPTAGKKRSAVKKPVVKKPARKPTAKKPAAKKHSPARKPLEPA